MTKKKILFVDDEEVILRSFCVALTHKGFITSSAISGEAAVKMLQKNSYDVVITDLRMPGIDGIQVLKEARILYPQIIVIVLTGYGDMESAIDSLRLGADDYLHKPCDVAELLCRLERCLIQKEVELKLLVEKQKNDHYEMITTLAGGLSHDFNNILTGIMGCLEIMARKTSGSDVSGYLGMAKDCCDQARELILKFIQISDMYKPEIASISVDGLLASLVKKVDKNNTSNLDIHISENTRNVLIDFDKTLIALEAVLINARESIASTGEISVFAENFEGKLPYLHHSGLISYGKFVKITIKDNGIGISQSNIQKIFNPYFSTKEKGATKAMGFGLTIAAILIRRCNGQIQVESEINRGTEVSVFLETIK